MEGFATTSDPRGRRANSPGEIPARGLRDVAWRLYESLTSDRILLVAAGVEVIPLDKAPFEQAMKPIYDQFVTDPKLKDMITQIKAAK